MSFWITKFVFYAILSVSFVIFVVAPALASLVPSYSVDTDFYYALRENYRSEQKICTDGSQCRCYVGRTLVGNPVMCIKCSGKTDCGTTFMSDGEKCRECLLQCPDAACDCIQNCKQRCLLPENPVTRVAIGCGIIMFATAVLAFFCKVFLVCCFSSVPVGRPLTHHEDDAASLNSVDRLVAQRLRDAPPRYDALVSPNSGEPRTPRPPRSTFSPLDKPPPYRSLPNRGELCLQVTTLLDMPPPYSAATAVAYLNTLSLPQTQIPSAPVSVPSPTTAPANPPPANTPPANTPPAYAPPANTPPLPPLEPGRDLCRTFTL